MQVALLALRMEDGGRAEFAGAAAKARMQRLVCGFFEEDNARFGGGTKARRAMLRQVRSSGLEVQRAAKGVAKQLEADMVEYGKQWASIRRLAHRWLAVTRRSGPARIRQVQEIGMARDKVRACMQLAHRQGHIPCGATAWSREVWCGQDPRPALGSDSAAEAVRGRCAGDSGSMRGCASVHACGDG